MSRRTTVKDNLSNMTKYRSFNPANRWDFFVLLLKNSDSDKRGNATIYILLVDCFPKKQ